MISSSSHTSGAGCTTPPGSTRSQLSVSSAVAANKLLKEPIPRDRYLILLTLEWFFFLTFLCSETGYKSGPHSQVGEIPIWMFSCCGVACLLWDASELHKTWSLWQECVPQVSSQSWEIWGKERPWDPQRTTWTNNAIKTKIRGEKIP